MIPDQEQWDDLYALAHRNAVEASAAKGRAKELLKVNQAQEKRIMNLRRSNRELSAALHRAKRELRQTAISGPSKTEAGHVV
mgnify:CR=1 FL=1